jgi:hypothetical protein
MMSMNDPGSVKCLLMVNQDYEILFRGIVRMSGGTKLEVLLA